MRTLRHMQFDQQDSRIRVGRPMRKYTITETKEGGGEEEEVCDRHLLLAGGVGVRCDWSIY
jgi:hypothetical protein